jgi:Phosphotransferase enzyme family
VLGSSGPAEEVDSLRPRSFASTVGVWRVRCAGRTAVLKLIRLGAAPSPRWPSEPDPADPYYWRREALVYGSGVLDGLDGLRTPDLLGSFEREDGSVAIWLEDVPQSPPWTPERLGAFARRLGAAQALLTRRLPDEDWLPRGFLRRYLQLHEIGGTECEAVLAQLDALPHTLAHNDLHPANIHGDGTVVLDWAFCGLAPLGLDAGVLVGDGVADDVIHAEQADAAGTAVWDGYSAGLRDAGFDGDVEAIRWAFLRGTALRLSWLDPDRTREDWMKEPWRAAISLLKRWREVASGLPSEP